MMYIVVFVYFRLNFASIKQEEISVTILTHIYQKWKIQENILTTSCFDTWDVPYNPDDYDNYFPFDDEDSFNSNDFIEDEIIRRMLSEYPCT